MIPVKDFPGLYRDENSKAIINCSDEEFNNYMQLKNAALRKENEIDSLKREIDELKTLVYQLLNK